MASERIGIVVGLRAEARIARKLGWDVAVGGGDAAGAARAAETLVARGANALVSFGLAGGLDPGLRPGTILVPRAILVNGEQFACDPELMRRLGGMTPHVILGGDTVLASAEAKRTARRQSQASAVDLESAPVARVAQRHNLRLAAMRAICDPAERGLPPAALLALNQRGGINPLQVTLSVLRNPGQLPTLLALARDATQGRTALLRRTDELINA